MYDSSSRRELGAALAAAFLVGAWNEDRLVRRGAYVLEPRPRWLRAVVREVLAAYHRPPADRPRELAAYVVLALEERRGVAAAPRVRRWRMDIEDFFASVPAARVYGIFRTAGYPQAAAHTLAALCVTVARSPNGIGWHARSTRR